MPAGFSWCSAGLLSPVKQFETVARLQGTALLSLLFPSFYASCKLFPSLSHPPFQLGAFSRVVSLVENRRGLVRTKESPCPFFTSDHFDRCLGVQHVRERERRGRSLMRACETSILTAPVLRWTVPGAGPRDSRCPFPCR